MSYKTLFRIAALFALFTFLGHTVGVIQGPPADQNAVQTTYEIMKQTMVVFPVGEPKSIATLMVGANACLSVYLLLSGLIFIIFSSATNFSKQDKQMLFLNSLGLIAVAVISAVFLFPIPAVCTGLAGVVGLLALRKSNSDSLV